MPDRFTALELRQAQIANPDLAPLDLWQVADLAVAWIRRKKQFRKDFTTQRRHNPEEPDHLWFARELSGFRDWKDALDSMKGPESRSPAMIAEVEARQLTLDEQPKEIIERGGWTLPYVQMLSGIDDIDGEGITLADYPDRRVGSWRELPRWVRALLAGVYRPGSALLSGPKPGTFPARVASLGAAIERSRAPVPAPNPPTRAPAQPARTLEEIARYKREQAKRDEDARLRDEVTQALTAKRNPPST